MSAADSGNDGDRRERKRRLFFALWPDDQTRAVVFGATRSIVEHSGGRATPAENLHVTLAFLGDVGDAEFTQVRKMPTPLCEGFELSIDTLEHRKRPRLLWAVPGTVPAALLGLESWLWGRLEDLGIQTFLAPPDVERTRKVPSPSSTHPAPTPSRSSSGASWKKAPRQSRR